MLQHFSMPAFQQSALVGSIDREILAEFEDMEVSNDQSQMSIVSQIESGKNAVSQRRRNMQKGQANAIHTRGQDGFQH